MGRLPAAVPGARACRRLIVVTARGVVGLAGANTAVICRGAGTGGKLKTAHPYTPKTAGCSKRRRAAPDANVLNRAKITAPLGDTERRA